MSEKAAHSRPVFVYDTHGDWRATQIDSALYNLRGEYIGYLDGGDVYKRDGEWIGRLSKDGRIVRKRAERRRELAPDPPPAPPRPDRLPARAPLPPMMAELNFSVIDVLEEYPDIFNRVSDLRRDLD